MRLCRRAACWLWALAEVEALKQPFQFTRCHDLIELSDEAAVATNSMSLAAGVAAVEVMRDEGLVEHAAHMQSVMLDHMRQLADKHPSVASYRATGLFGAIEMQKNAQGEPLSGYNETHPAVAKFIKTLLAKGVFTLSHWNMIFCNPPLCITEEQLAETFAVVDECLQITDDAYEG